FNAPRRLVFQALTKPQFVRRWLGVFGGWTFPVCEIDFRVGGTYRYVWRGPDGAEMGMRGVYTEIVENEKIISTEKFDESWYEGEASGRVELSEKNGRTTLTMTLTYESKKVRDSVIKSPMEKGVAAGYNNLDALLDTMQQGGAVMNQKPLWMRILR